VTYGGPRPGWVRRLREEGVDPDARFSLANERTFLAWIRTSLAFVAAGIGVDAFVTDAPDWLRKSLACLLIVIGGTLAATAFGRWLRSELALRRSAPLPVNQLAPFIAFGLAVGAVAAVVLVVVER
jgi:putative membrane protein